MPAPTPTPTVPIATPSPTVLGSIGRNQGLSTMPEIEPALVAMGFCFCCASRVATMLVPNTVSANCSRLVMPMLVSIPPPIPPTIPAIGLASGPTKGRTGGVIAIAALAPAKAPRAIPTPSPAEALKAPKGVVVICF